MRRNRRVKIVATLGPASNNEKTIRALFEAGADVFRINMSHATPEALRQSHAIIRKIEAEFSRPIGILIDLQGPKLRIGKFESGAIRLTEGDIVSFVRRESVGGLGRVHLPHPEIFQAVQPGHALLLDDGKLMLNETSGQQAAARCVRFRRFFIAGPRSTFYCCSCRHYSGSAPSTSAFPTSRSRSTIRSSGSVNTTSPRWPTTSSRRSRRSGASTNGPS